MPIGKVTLDVQSDLRDFGGMCQEIYAQLKCSPRSALGKKTQSDINSSWLDLLPGFFIKSREPSWAKSITSLQMEQWFGILSRCESSDYLGYLITRSVRIIDMVTASMDEKAILSFSQFVNVLPLSKRKLNLLFAIYPHLLVLSEEQSWLTAETVKAILYSLQDVKDGNKIEHIIDEIRKHVSQLQFDEQQINRSVWLAECIYALRAHLDKGVYAAQCLLAEAIKIADIKIDAEHYFYLPDARMNELLSLLKDKYVFCQGEMKLELSDCSMDLIKGVCQNRLANFKVKPFERLTISWNELNCQHIYEIVNGLFAQFEKNYNKMYLVKSTVEDMNATLSVTGGGIKRQRDTEQKPSKLMPLPKKIKQNEENTKKMEKLANF